jgi:hypothetical protein
VSKAWAYRATTAGASLKDTLALLLDEQFLCRTAFARTSNGKARLIPFVGRIHPGDDLHIYFSAPGAPRWLGSFVVVAPPDGSADAKGRAPAIGLVNKGSPLALRLEKLGYSKDPQR